MASAIVQGTTPHSTLPSNNPSSTSTPPDAPLHLPSQWHFPGPSSRFNQRERASTQSRPSITRPITPSWSTDRRAHRRAHSSYTVSTTHATSERAATASFNRKPGSAHARFNLPYSPPSSDSGRSPLSRFGSFTMADAGNEVVTPSRKIGNSHHDSPFSDYFTDDNRSIDGIASQSLTASGTQQLLLRLNKLQTTLLLGGNDAQALYLVGRRMSEIENDMDSLHSQSRQPPELDDSGLFMEEDDEEEEDEAEEQSSSDMAATRILSLDGTNDHKTVQTTDQGTQTDGQEQPEDKSRIAAAVSEVSKSLAAVYAELRRRMHEFQAQREEFDRLLREKDAELTALRADRECMQQDLKLDHSDFVLLDGQLRLLQNRLSRVSKPTEDDIPAIEAMRLDCRKAIENTTKTRQRYSSFRSDATSHDRFDEVVKQGRWKMDVVRNPNGRVDLMTLARQQCEDDDDVELRAIPRIEITEISATVMQHKQDHILYVDSVTQCDVQPENQEEDLCEDENHDPRPGLRQHLLEEDPYISDCAITTSPPSECGGSPTIYDNENTRLHTTARVDDANDKKPQYISAWHELWHSMADFAGVGEHRW